MNFDALIFPQQSNNKHILALETLRNSNMKFIDNHEDRISISISDFLAKFSNKVQKLYEISH